MPSPGLGTFNPTHSFHPLLRAAHSIESEEDFFFFFFSREANPGNKLSQQELENCLGQPNSGTLSASSPNKKASRASPPMLYNTGWPQAHNQGACNTAVWFMLKNSFLFGYDALFLCFPLLPSMSDPKALPCPSDGSLAPGSQGRREWASWRGMALGLAEAGRHLGGCQRG